MLKNVNKTKKMAHPNVNKTNNDLQILVLETSLLNFIGALTNAMATVLLVWWELIQQFICFLSRILPLKLTMLGH